MAGPIKSVMRRKALKNGSNDGASTGMKPLSTMHKVVIFVDPSATDTQAVCEAARRFFYSRHLKVVIVSPSKDDLDWTGRIKDKVREALPHDEDLFVSLVGGKDTFAADYEAVCSHAAVKVGRHQIPENKVFNFVVSVPPEASQMEALEGITSYLSKIK